MKNNLLKGRIAALLLIVLSGFCIGAFAQVYTYPANDDALESLESNFVMQVTETPLFIRFDNQLISRSVGLIIQPGGEVDPRAYARIARKIAGPGYRVIIDKTPSELVIAGVVPNMIPTIKASNPDVQTWALAGHSLGGVTAAQYIAENPQDTSIEGLALWAAFPNPGLPIADRTDLAVASIYGENDCLATPETILSLSWTLPANASFVQLDGANHAQWGDYGDQVGDCAADITTTVQKIRGKRATVDHVLTLID